MRPRLTTPQAYEEYAKLLREYFAKIEEQEPEPEVVLTPKHGVFSAHKLEPYDLWAARYDEPGQQPQLVGIYATEKAARQGGGTISDNYVWHEGRPLSTTSDYMLYVCGAKPKMNRPNVRVLQTQSETHIIYGHTDLIVRKEVLCRLPGKLAVDILLCAGNFRPYSDQ